jgi:hypothetical protein
MSPKIYRYTMNVRAWPELDGTTSYAVCFHSATTRRKSAIIPVKCGAGMSDLNRKLVEYYISNGYTFSCTFNTLELATQYFAPFAEARAKEREADHKARRQASR